MKLYFYRGEGDFAGAVVDLISSGARNWRDVHSISGGKYDAQITEHGVGGVTGRFGKIDSPFLLFSRRAPATVTKTTFPPTPQLRPDRGLEIITGLGRLKVFDGNSEGGRYLGGFRAEW